MLVEDKAENPDILKGTGDKGRTNQTAEGRFQKEVTIRGEGRAEYGEFLFTRPGTYAYRIYEVNTGAEGYTYDEAVYTVAYTVSEKDGKIPLTVTGGSCIIHYVAGGTASGAISSIG